MEKEGQCKECGGRKWVHCSAPFELRGCSRCSLSHDAAVIKHRKDHPQCQWPDRDLQHAFKHFMNAAVDTTGPEMRDLVVGIREQGSNRLLFQQRLPSIISKLGEALNELDPVPCEYLSRALSFAVQSVYRLGSGKWTLGHALTPADGDSKEDQWSVRPLEQDR